MVSKLFPNMLVFLKSRTAVICFFFKSVTIEGIYKKILALDGAKATQSDDFPTKIIKNNFNFF